MIVIVIIGVLATLAIVQLSGPKEQALEKEAKANLKLIAAAEKIYRMEVGGYITASNETAINDMLRLMLPKGAARNWGYNVTASADGTQFTANATRTTGPMIRTYNVTQELE
jgi:type II secretory pathway pseudopilin PulG